MLSLIVCKIDGLEDSFKQFYYINIVENKIQTGNIRDWVPISKEEYLNSFYRFTSKAFSHLFSSIGLPTITVTPAGVRSSEFDEYYHNYFTKLKNYGTVRQRMINLMNNDYCVFNYCFDGEALYATVVKD